VRTIAEYERVVALRTAGHTYDEIVAMTGISRSGVIRWLAAPPAWVTRPRACRRDGVIGDPSLHATYAYLLGLYLGDGHLVHMKNDVAKLSIVQDSTYAELIAECEVAMAAISGRRVNQARKCGSTAIYGYSKHWPCLFPQHGPGLKHQRAIELAGWQRELADRHPKDLLRGLIHSDGCRVMNRVWGGKYAYPRYFFSNRSADIHAIFRHACDLLGVRWCQNHEWNTNVARRDDVAFFDTFIGPKR
jgi:uncharacterized protein YerC